MCFFMFYILATGKWYSTGIVSTGSGCAMPNSYGIYADVAYFKNWIIETILNKFSNSDEDSSRTKE